MMSQRDLEATLRTTLHHSGAQSAKYDDMIRIDAQSFMQSHNTHQMDVNAFNTAFPDIQCLMRTYAARRLFLVLDTNSDGIIDAIDLNKCVCPFLPLLL